MNWFSRIWTWFRGVDIDDQVTKIQKMTVLCCGFLPTAGTVASIITAGNPTVLTATAVATAICEAVTRRNKVATLLGNEMANTMTPTVNGVEIKGEYVK